LPLSSALGRTEILQSIKSRIVLSPLGYRLAKGVFWSLGGSFIQKLMQAICAGFLAKIMGTVRFGELGAVQSTIGMLGTFAGFGLSLTATRYIARFKVHDPERAGRIRMLSNFTAWGTGIFVSLIMVGVAPILADRVLAAPHLKNALQIGAAYLLLTTICGAQTGVLAGLEEFRLIAVVNLISGIAYLPLVIIGAHIGGLSGALWGMTASMGLLWSLNHLAIRRACESARIPRKAHKWWDELHTLWNFSVPTLLANVASAPVFWVCTSILVNTPNGYSEMGIFSAANVWRTFLMFVPLTVLQATLPVMSSTYKTDQIQFRRVIEVCHNFVNIPIMSICITAMFFSDLVMGIFGKAYANGSFVLIGLLASAIIQSSGCAIGGAMQARGEMWLNFALNLIWGLLNLGLVYALARQMGAISMALGNVVGYFVLVILQIIKLGHDIPIRMRKSIVRAWLVAGLSTLGAILGHEIMPILVRAVVGLFAATLAGVLSWSHSKVSSAEAMSVP